MIRVQIIRLTNTRHGGRHRFEMPTRIPPKRRASKGSHATCGIERHRLAVQRRGNGRVRNPAAIKPRSLCIQGDARVQTERTEGVVRVVVHRNGCAVNDARDARNAIEVGVPSPRTGSGSWSPTSIRPMLRRERYIGRIVWGQKHKTYRRGTKVRGDPSATPGCGTAGTVLALVPS